MPLPSGWKKKNLTWVSFLRTFHLLMLLFVRLMTFIIRYVPLKKSVSLIIKIICWRHLWKKLDTIYHLKKRHRIGSIQLTRLLYHLDKEIQRSQMLLQFLFGPSQRKLSFRILKQKKYYAVKCPQITTSTMTTWLLTSKTPYYSPNSTFFCFHFQNT